jgi:mannose-6-phosphate isomerase-like protein (cupin superfamily)
VNFRTDIEKETTENQFFRRVLYTDSRLQLVVMSLKPNEDIGMESHDLDQFIRIEKGNGKAIVNDEEFPLSDGVAVIVPKGAVHNIINTSSTDSLKLYTIYAPANHPPETIHKTKEEAMAAEEHEHLA